MKQPNNNQIGCFSQQGCSFSEMNFQRIYFFEKETVK
jgi:hypothetical protein